MLRTVRDRHRREDADHISIAFHPSSALTPQLSEDKKNLAQVQSATLIQMILGLEKRLELQKDELEYKRILDVQSIAVASHQRQIEQVNKDNGALTSKFQSLEMKFVSSKDRGAEPLKQIQQTATTGGHSKRLKKNMSCQSLLSCTVKLEGADSGDKKQKDKKGLVLPGLAEGEAEVLPTSCEYCGFKFQDSGDAKKPFENYENASKIVLQNDPGG